MSETKKVKIRFASIEPNFDSPVTMLIANIVFEKDFQRDGTKFRNRASVSVMVEKRNQSLDELHNDAIAEAKKFLSELSDDH